MTTRIATAAGAGPDTRFFVPFAKVEENADGSVYVEGIATAEVLDLDGEVVTHEASVDAFREWTEYTAKVTAGASLGNIREMHGKSAAGKAVNWTRDDDAKTNSLGLQVIDSEAAKKTKARVYTGLSIGGCDVKREMRTIDGKQVPVVTSYRLNEVSLVDKPACPAATFTLVKRESSNDKESEMQKTTADTCGENGQHLFKSDSAACLCGAATLTKSDTPADPVADPPVDPEPDDKPKGDDPEVPAADPAVPPAEPDTETIENAVKAQLAPVLDAIAKLPSLLEPMVKALIEGSLTKAAGAHDLTKLEESVASIKKAIDNLPAPPPGRAIQKALGDGSGTGAPDMDAFVKIADEALAKAAASGTPKAAIEAMRLSFVTEAMKRI